MAARQAHNLKVGGSNPPSATKESCRGLLTIIRLNQKVWLPIHPPQPKNHPERFTDNNQAKPEGLAPDPPSATKKSPGEFY